MTDDYCAKNTDTELFREKSEVPYDSDNYYAPSVFVTNKGKIGMNVGGYVFIKSIREWHSLAKEVKL